MLYENHMNVHHYFVVMVIDDYITYFEYLCMFRLECKPSYVNQQNMANKLDL
jgi:hypothetical protein